MVYSYQPSKASSAIIFDCDGTLSAIEGINELAKNNQMENVVKTLTEEAMGKTGLTAEIYQKRLNLVKPTAISLVNLGYQYIKHQVLHAKETIALLKAFNKQIYLVSAGLMPAIRIFAAELAIPYDHLYAVNVYFDRFGNFMDFDTDSPLIHSDGKRSVVSIIKEKHDHLVFVGDGLNDLAVRDLVNRFIGYGGVYFREKIANQCEYYIKDHSFTTLLPLILTEEEVSQIPPAFSSLYQIGLNNLLKTNKMTKNF